MATRPSAKKPSHQAKGYVRQPSAKKAPQGKWEQGPPRAKATTTPAQNVGDDERCSAHTTTCPTKASTDEMKCGERYSKATLQYYPKASAYQAKSSTHRLLARTAFSHAQDTRAGQARKQQARKEKVDLNENVRLAAQKADQQRAKAPRKAKGVPPKIMETARKCRQNGNGSRRTG